MKPHPLVVVLIRVTISIVSIVVAINYCSALVNAKVLPTDLALENIETLNRTIYHGVRDIYEIPKKFLFDIVVRYKLKEFVKDLKLDKDVEDRMIRHIESETMSVKIIPFLFFIKELYWKPANGELDSSSFDDYFKTELSAHWADQKVALGIEHSMFKRPTQSSEKADAFKLDKKIFRHLFEFYDALFLVDDTFRLDGQPHLLREAQINPVVARAKPRIRALLYSALESVSAKVESAKPGKPADSRNATEENLAAASSAIEKVLKDEEMLHNIVITLIDFLYSTTHRHYQMLALRAQREIKLKNWMKIELRKEVSASHLWSYLKDAQFSRRYVVHIGVDGLQGHLMRSLAKGSSGDAFLESVRSEYNRRGELQARFKNFPAAKEQSIQFLNYISEFGFQDSYYLPFFRRLYLHNYANSIPSVIANSGVSTTPTISVRNLPILFTGAPVVGRGGTGIPNFHFVKRQGEDQGPYYFWGNDALLLPHIAHAEKNGQPGMKTVFDRLEYSSLNCFASPYDRGASIVLDGIFDLLIGERLRDFGDQACLRELNERVKTEKKLRDKRTALLEKKDFIRAKGVFGTLRGVFNPILGEEDTQAMKNALALIDEIAELEDQGLPQYFMYYNPWPDHFSHFTGPFSDEIISPSGELNRLDYWLSKIHSAYEKAGVLDRTLFGMAGDHGLAPVFVYIDPEKEIIEYSRGQGFPIASKKISATEGEPPSLVNRFHRSSVRDLDVVLASTAGGNYMMDFFIHNPDLPKNEAEVAWHTQPEYNQLIHHRLLSGQIIDVPSVILSRLKESLDYMVVREGPCDEDNTWVRVIGFRNNRRIDEILRRVSVDGTSRVFYGRKAGGDLLQTLVSNEFDSFSEIELREYERLNDQCINQAKEQTPSTWCAADEWTQLTRYTFRPDSVVQLAHLYDTDLAGTINLFPARGIGYNTTVPGRHAGEDFHEKDAFVGFWGAGVRGELGTASIGSLAPTHFEFITGKVPVVEDGWGYPSLLKELK